MYTYITENDPECKKAKYINKNAADDKLKYEDYKTFLFSKVYMRYEISRFQNKDHNIGTYRINKVYLPRSNKKYIVLKMHTIGHHIFINLFGNRTQRK